MSNHLKKIAYILDNSRMTAVTGLEPNDVIELLTKLNYVMYKYLLVTPYLIPYTQKQNTFWYDINIVEPFISDSVDFGVYLPDKEAPLLIRDYKKQLTFMIAPDGGRNANNYKWE